MTKQIQNFKDILLDQIEVIAEKLLKLAYRCQAVIDKMESTKRSPTKTHNLIIVKPEGALEKKFLGDIRDRNLNLTIALFMHSALSWSKALSECQAGRLEDALRHLLKAQSFLGQAMAHSYMDKIESALARSKAQLSHNKTRSMRTKVINHWRKNLLPELSAEKAADELFGIFKWKDGKDVAHRTLAAWIAHARRPIPPQK